MGDVWEEALDYLMKSKRVRIRVGLTFDGWRFCVQPYHAKGSVSLPLGQGKNLVLVTGGR